MCITVTQLSTEPKRDDADIYKKLGDGKIKALVEYQHESGMRFVISVCFSIPLGFRWKLL